MPRRFFVILGLLVALAAPVAQAQAQTQLQEFDEELLTQCALHKAIAALTCKPFGEFYFLGKRQGVYIFTGYWAMHYTEFYAQIQDNNLAVFSSPDWGRSRISARIRTDYVKGCVEVRVQKTPCNSIKDTQCCAGKPVHEPEPVETPLAQPKAAPKAKPKTAPKAP